MRGREFEDAIGMLRMILAYCLGDGGLRSTAAWAASIGLADIANTALLYRLRQSGDWLAWLVGQALASAAPKASQGRLIRAIDATHVPKAGAAAKKENKLWRIHSAFDLPCERFGHFELTDEREGERLDRIPAVKGEIRLAYRAILRRSASLLSLRLEPISLSRRLEKGALARRPRRALRSDRRPEKGRQGQENGHANLARPQEGSALGLRLVAVRKPAHAIAESRRKARRAAQRERSQIADNTLIAAEWVILVTSLPAETYSTDDVLALYRLRWRIEHALKRLKSLIGLKAPPGVEERSAKPYVLAHLLVIYCSNR